MYHAYLANGKITTKVVRQLSEVLQTDAPDSLTEYSPKLFSGPLVYSNSNLYI